MTIPTDRASFRAAMRAHLDAVRPRIEASIREHRTADLVVTVVDANGQPVPGATVAVEQTGGEVRFGANAFLLGGNGTPEADRRWEDLFADAFDLAVVPFFWKDLEPERGSPRFAIDSPPRYRRPPVDAVLDFCTRRGIEPKAHALTYHQFVPEWMPTDPVECERLHGEWFATVGARYRGRIPSWDVVNEALSRYGWIFADRPVPKDWIAWSFAAARRHLPGARLILNEDTSAWVQRGWAHFGHEVQPYSLLIENLLMKGVPIDEIGMQFHLFDYQEADSWKRASAHKDVERLLEPGYLLGVLDHYARFGRPIHISEITVPCFGTTADDEDLQAEIAEMLYRTWFSHPAVASIVWWNVVDGHAYGKEGELRGGLVNKDLSTKAVYRVLRRLIREEWRTRASAATTADGTVIARAFHGRHRVTVTHAGRSIATELSTRRDAPGRITVVV